MGDHTNAEQANASGAAAIGCCHHKQTPRSTEFQADLQKRLNRAIGQLNGVKNMLDDNRYCGDVLVQLAAAESAIRSVSGMLLQDHLETCVVEQIRQGNDEVIEEVMQLMKRFSR
ncbi:metal-sensing transcriptional repressor [Raoultibacter phocaeensis]|uniref:metal-sensing transcriptional repressor n=1 Tax=Raoultibacter phocaeensis TaxID=2479841 RepID=UPI00111AAD35|nr:metal-sensing transcriptional repressor [Raoultibacter phocaeensis]